MRLLVILRLPFRVTSAGLQARLSPDAPQIRRSPASRVSECICRDNLGRWQGGIEYLACGQSRGLYSSDMRVFTADLSEFRPRLPCRYACTISCAKSEFDSKHSRNVA